MYVCIVWKLIQLEIFQFSLYKNTEINAYLFTVKKISKSTLLLRIDKKKYRRMPKKRAALKNVIDRESECCFLFLFRYFDLVQIIITTICFHDLFLINAPFFPRICIKDERQWISYLCLSHLQQLQWQLYNRVEAFVYQYCNYWIWWKMKRIGVTLSEMEMFERLN